MRRCILVLGVVACGRAPAELDRGSAEPPLARSPEFRASYSGSLTRLQDGHELVVTARDMLRDPARQDIEIELAKAMTRARPCMEGIYGTVFANLELDREGKVTKSHVESPLLEGTPIATCIEDALRSMTTGKLAAAPVEIRYPVRNMPSQEQMQEAAKMIQRGL